MTSEREIGIYPVLHHLGLQLRQSRDLRLCERLIPEISQRRAPPQGQRFAETLRRAVGGAGGEQAPRVFGQALEPRYVNLLLGHLQQIAAGLGQHARAVGHRIQPLAQPPDVDIDRVVGTGRRMLAPDVLDEHVATDRLVRVQQQARQ